MKKTKTKNKNASFAVFAVFIFISIAIIFVWKGDKIVKSQTYPREYSELVIKYSEEYGVDKNLIYAIIRTESGFDPQAISNVGAIGLMQIMETTYDWTKSKIGDTRSHVYDDLFDPELNIQYGTFLISRHLAEFDSIENALAAYHAGRGNVNKWLDDPTLTDNGKDIHTIPILATETYIKKVTSAYEKYSKLDGQSSK